MEISDDRLAKILEAAIRAAKAPNPLEQKAIDEAIEKDKRRTLLSIELGKAEEESRWRKQNSCSHSRDEKTGLGVARGKGQWTTGGQLHSSNRTASLHCLRCGTAWIWPVTFQEWEHYEQQGMLGMAPPPIEKCLNKDDFVERPQARVPSNAVNMSPAELQDVLKAHVGASQ